VINRYIITITVPSSDETFSSLVVSICPGGVKVSCQKEKGITLIPLRERSRHEFLIRLPDGEKIHVCLGTRSIKVLAGGVQIGETSKNFAEGYLM
jgi:hypothetical protein